MIQSLKHLKYYSNYISEQEEFEEGEAPVKPKEKIFTFLFLEEGEDGEHVYPDGSSTKRFTTYQISQGELDIWLSDNIVEGGDLSKSAVEVKKKALFDYISGVKSNLSPDDKQYIDKFKNNAIADIEGKKIQDTEVLFTPGERQPTTDEIDVTFIITAKK